MFIEPMFGVVQGIVAALPLVLGVGGAVAQAIAGIQAQRAAQQRMDAELMRQTKLRDEGQRTVVQNIQATGAESAKRDLSQGKAEIKKEYEGLQGITPQASGLGVSDTSTVRDERDKARTGNTNENRATLFGANEWQLQQAIKNLRAQQQIQALQSFQRGSSAVLPFELNDAAHSQDTLAGIGKLMGLAGSVMGMANASGVLGGAGAGAPSAAQVAALDAGQGMLAPTTAARLAPSIASTKAVNSALLDPNFFTLTGGPGTMLPPLQLTFNR